MAMKTLRVTKDEWTFFGTLLPYFAMIMGALLTLLMGVVTRVGIMLQYNVSQTPFDESSRWLTYIVIISCTILSIISWKLFSQRRGQFLALHATLTVICAHLWLIMAIWQDKGEWIFGAPTFYVFFYGSVIIALSWCIRRWSFRDESPDDEYQNPFEAAGLGSARIDARNSRDVIGGRRFRLKLPIGKTIEDAKNKRIALAQIAGKSRNLVHVTETESGVEGQVDVLILEDHPFRNKVVWEGPEFRGDPITSPITYATYSTGDRPELYIAGKNGASSQHFLTMGMPGTGKSKAWQVIYGTVLNRTEVSVIFGDPAKAMQTGGPLAAGLAWFATTYDECIEQMDAIKRAIPARTDFLTAKGLDHWVQGCGINFLIFHLEEAARFAEVDELIELVEAARSAGIAIVISLQRATNDRLKTSARFNLGGNMCFGVKMKRDASFGLSEHALESGADPHKWQDRYPGQHYLEASGIDPRKAGYPLMADWIDIAVLEREVDLGDSIRNDLDEVTANALGPAYFNYRTLVQENRTNWQRLRLNRDDGWEDDLIVEEPDISLPEESDTPEEKVSRKFGFATPTEETEQYRQHLRRIIQDFKDNGKDTFTPADIRQAGLSGRTPAWLSQNLRKLRKQGVLSYDRKSKFYIIN